MNPYKSYEDWYDNGPGSEAFKRNLRRDNMDIRDPVFKMMDKMDDIGTRVLITPGGKITPFPPCCNCNARLIDCNDCEEETLCMAQNCGECLVTEQCGMDNPIEVSEPEPEPIMPGLDVNFNIDMFKIEAITNGYLISYEIEGKSRTKFVENTKSFCGFIERHIRRP